MDIRYNGSRINNFSYENLDQLAGPINAAQTVKTETNQPLPKVAVALQRGPIELNAHLLRSRLQAATSLKTTAQDNKLAQTKLSFSEDMKGNFAAGDMPFDQAESIGKSEGNNISFHANMKIDNMDKFLNSPEHEAKIEGYINYPPLGGKLPIIDGKFNLFVANPDTGEKQMHYQITFKGNDGKTYLLDGVKHVKDDPGFDIWSDNTTLYTKIYQGGTTDGKVVSTGVMHIGLADTLKLVKSMNIQAPDAGTKAKAIEQFGKFFLGTLWDEFFAGKFTRLFSLLGF